MNIRNPRTGLEDYKLQVDSAQQIELSTHDIRAAQISWHEKGVAYRVDVISKWLSEIKKAEKEIVAALTTDTGRENLSRLEFNAICGLLQGWMFAAPNLLKQKEVRASETNPTVDILQQLSPYALVGVISPWNFPLLLALMDTIPALLAGSGVILKPSEVTPRFIDPLEKTIKAVPELNAIIKLARGAADTGKAIVQQVDALCFTGSVATGRKIAAACADRFIPAFLELGGKDPAIVLPDADIDMATDAILRSCAGAGGQACQSLERIYVHSSLHDEFIEVLTQKAKQVTLNTTSINDGILGPIIFKNQAEIIDAHVQDALAKGAKKIGDDVLENNTGGIWARPIILTNVDHTMDVMRNETFGPLMPIMSFDKIEEAIRLANDSIYGLSASVFSKDVEQAIEVASKIDAGAISINDGSLTTKVFDAEKNAFKYSGMNGSRMGEAGLMRFFRKKAILIQRDRPQRIDEV